MPTPVYKTSGGKFVLKAGKLACTCCGPPINCQECYSCCVSDQSTALLPSLPTLTARNSGGADPLDDARSAAIVDVVNALTPLTLAWSTLWEYAYTSPGFVVTGYGGTTYYVYVRIQRNCSSGQWLMDVFYYSSADATLRHVVGGVLAYYSNMTCCGFRSERQASGGASPAGIHTYIGNIDVVVQNNKCCKCAGGNCVPTSDGSVAICTDGINTCTSAQDDNCPP